MQLMGKPANVRFGSLADICSAKEHVRFTPNSDRKSGFPHKVMSALPPKADTCSALAYVSAWGQKRTSTRFIRSLRQRALLAKHGFRTSQQLKAHPHRIISRSIAGRATRLSRKD
jgi:hypothetical protein